MILLQIRKQLLLTYGMQWNTICHVIVKDKVAKQYNLEKYCKCNSFGDAMDLLRG